MIQKIILPVLFAILLQQTAQAQSGSWSANGNSLTGTEKLGSINGKPVNFFTNNTQRMTLTAGGLLGIGTKIPKSLLHIFRGAGASVGIYDPDLTLITESAANNFIGVFAPNSKESGILLGNTSAEAGIIYNPLNSPHGMQFRTSFGTNMTLSQLGDLGIGTEEPIAPLHVLRGTSSALPPEPNSLIVAENFGDAFFSMLTPSNKRSGILFGNSFNGSDGGLLFNDGATKRGLQFRTAGNTTRMVLTGAGQLGIGTLQPAAALHLAAGSAGIAPVSGSTIVTERSSDNFISILTPAANKSALLFGTSQNSQDGAIVYNNPSAPRGMQFNTAGITHMTLTSTGLLGVNNSAPLAELDVTHGVGENGAHGLRLQNGGVNKKSWTLYTANNDGVLEFISDSLQTGFFQPASGEYYSVSDVKRKKDMEPSEEVLKKLMQLEVKKYHFVKENGNRKHYGTIAQEVEKIFPELVMHTSGEGQDQYAVNYGGYGVIAVKAIQEQQQKIESLEKRIEQLEAALNKTITSNNSNSAASVVSKATNHILAQNQPNPCSQSTIIRYQLPQGSSGIIQVYDMGGTLVKSVRASGNQAVLNTSDLKAGTYTYTLSAGGSVIGSKQMVVVK